MKIIEVTHSFRYNVHYYGGYLDEPVEGENANQLFKDYLLQKRFDLGSQVFIHLWVFYDKDDIPDNFGTVDWTAEDIKNKCLAHAFIDLENKLEITFDIEI